MKKVAVILSIVFVLALLLSSCKTHESCPAYGKADIKKKVEDRA